jgi:hypothetical protein
VGGRLGAKVIADWTASSGRGIPLSVGILPLPTRSLHQGQGGVLAAGTSRRLLAGTTRSGDLYPTSNADTPRETDLAYGVLEKKPRGAGSAGTAGRGISVPTVNTPAGAVVRSVPVAPGPVNGESPGRPAAPAGAGPGFLR